jgi:four helix bundle protein
MALVERVYALARVLPERERTVLCPQVCRAAISVPANIAEGHARVGPKAFAQFLSIARGSLMELETYLQLIERLGYAEKETTNPLLDEISQISRMLTALRRTLSMRSVAPTTMAT